jgi:hypothetical protein
MVHMLSLDTARAASIEDKLRSYVAAMAIIHPIRGDIVEFCRSLVNEQRPLLSRSLGVTATSPIKQYVYPDRDQGAGDDWAWIGVTITLIPDALWFSVGLCIEETDPKNPRVKGHAVIYPGTLAKAESILRGVSAMAPNAFVLEGGEEGEEELEEQDYGVRAEEPVTDATLGAHPDALRKAVDYWVRDSGKALSVVADVMGHARR